MAACFSCTPSNNKTPRSPFPTRRLKTFFDLFDRYTWHLDDTPGGQDDEINPDVLGYIFEKYINQKAFGAYYTRTEITEYLCERTIHQLVLDAVNSPEAGKNHLLPGVKPRQYASLGDLLLDLDAVLCRRLVHDVLPGLSLLDPACCLSLTLFPSPGRRGEQIALSRWERGGVRGSTGSPTRPNGPGCGLNSTAWSPTSTA